jgi:hypothetical protein
MPDVSHLGTMNPERAAKAAAKRIGVTHTEYLERRNNNQKWCSGCKEWHPTTAFGTNRSRADGLASTCRSAAHDARQRSTRTADCDECSQPAVGRLCLTHYRTRAARRKDAAETLIPYKRFARAVAVAARLEQQRVVAWARDMDARRDAA